MVSIKCIDFKWETHKNLFYIRIILWLKVNIKEDGSLLEHSKVQSLARWNILPLFCRQRCKLQAKKLRVLSQLPSVLRQGLEEPLVYCLRWAWPQMVPRQILKHTELTSYIFYHVSYPFMLNYCNRCFNFKKIREDEWSYSPWAFTPSKGSIDPY